jgi:glycosyltransferase involved in cell wall biosynthesis/GT2 family glycosyltransferase
MCAARTAKISVCLPVFNGEQFLGAAIESVLSQSHENLELLISDDGSQDSSWHIIEDFVRRDSRIRASRAPLRRGIFGNYNQCIQHASGQYLKFFAQDDLLDRGHLARCNDVLESSPAVALIACRRNWIDERNVDVSDVFATPSSSSVLPSNVQVNGLDVIRTCLVPPVNYIGEPATVMIRKELCGHGFDTTYHHLGDLDYWLRVLLHGDYYFIDEVLCSFRVHAGSQSRKNMRGLFFAPDLLQLGQKFGDHLEKLGCTGEQFHKECIRAIAAHIEFLGDNSQLSLAHLRSDQLWKQYEIERQSGTEVNSRLMADLRAFRELAFHALREVHSLEEKNRNITDSANRSGTLLVTSLERTLKSLMASQSWKMTKFLRDLNGSQCPEPPREGTPQCDDDLSDLEVYAAYLRERIQKITKSRSWKLTGPLRTFGWFDKALQLRHSAQNLAAMNELPLFDTSYYLAQNPDISPRHRVDALSHYLCRGGWEGRNPHPLFDSAFYLRRYFQRAQTQPNPLLHYLEEGAWQGLDPHPLFDTAFYVAQRPDLAKASFNPLLHYLEFGSKENLDPHPLFNNSFYREQMQRSGVPESNPLLHYLTVGAQQGFEPSTAFNGRSYCQRYPDVPAAGVNPLLHYVAWGLGEGRLGRQFDSIADGVRSLTGAAAKNALAKVRAAASAPISHLIVSGVLSRGGAERSACSYVRAIAERVGLDNILVLITDQADMTCLDWLPPNTRIVNLLQIERSLTVEERSILFLDLLSTARPETVIDCHVNLWRTELSTRFVGYLGGYETFTVMNDWGFNHGPINRLAQHFDLFITENNRLRDTMIEMYQHLPSIDKKVVSCYKSLTGDLHSLLQSVGSAGQDISPPPHKVLWASRLDRIKRPDLLAKIAEGMPDVQFEVYGCDSPGTDVSCLRRLPNVVMRGEYTDFSAIPTGDKALFLHTSEADGMPHVLLEASVRRLPIVAAHVGGISELIDESTGWLVEPSDDASAYVKAIRYVLEHPMAAKQRAEKAGALVDQRHRWTEFCRRIDQLEIWSSRKATHRDRALVPSHR